MANNTRKKNKGGIFWKIYAVVLLIVTIAIGVALYIGYDLMIDYDESQSYALKYSTQVAEDFKSGNFDLLFSDYSTLSVPMQFEKDEFIASLKEKVKDKEVIARKGYSKDRYEKPVYDILAGNVKLASLQFTKTGENSKYDFALFELEKVIPVSKGAYAVSVLVPKNATMTLNGKTWADHMWTSVTEEPDGTIYTIKGLMNEPKVEVKYTDTGEIAKLLYDNEREVWFAKLFSVVFSAPTGSNVTLNGKPINEYKFLEVLSNSPVSEAKTALKYVSAEVSYTKYEISGLQTLDEVVLEGTDFMGNPLNFEYNEAKKEYSAGVSHNKAALAKYGSDEEFIKKIAIEYAKFIMNDGDRWANLLPYIYRKSEIYDLFEDFWVVFSPHDYYWFENLEFVDLTCYADNLFSARVKLEYWIQGYDHKHDNFASYDVDVTFFYGKIDGKWQAIDFTLEEQN